MGPGVYAEVEIGLNHTGLSLVDLKEPSHQPIMWDETSQYCLLVKREIYEL